MQKQNCHEKKKALDRENNLEVAKVRSADLQMKDMDGDGENDL
jgi:hypothetical protein